MRGLWAELPELPSNRWHTQEHRGNSPRVDRNSTRSGEAIGVVVEWAEPGQLPEECRDWDRDKLAPDTSTRQDPRSTTSRADSHANHGTSDRHARRRYRAHENVRSRRAKKVLVSPDQAKALPPIIQKTIEPKLFFSLLLISLGDFCSKALTVFGSVQEIS